MGQFLYKLMPTRGEMLTDGLTGRENEVIENHLAYLADLKDRGRSSWPAAPPTPTRAVSE